ncbi:MAG: RDD family protein [Deltaproteobacteria bacterium]|nr:RDD family protein [Deltaproteobacteria bacterium]
MSTYENFNIQVKGYTVFGEKALTVVRILAFCIDALVFICGYFFFSMLYYLSPLPGLLDTAILIFLFLVYKFSFEKYLHCTVGQWFWKIKKTNKIYIQKEKLSIPNLSAVISLTIIFFSCSIYIFYTWIYQHPMLQKASIITIKSADLEQNISYERLPWFYTIGYWPKYFIDAEPLSFSLPYEKGPPLKFPGHIIVQS